MAENLSVGAIGAEVARLHEQLQQHNFEVPASEVGRKFFGPGTREAVLACQREHGFACTGAADESTTTLLSGNPPPPAGRIASPGAPAAHEVTRAATLGTQTPSPPAQGASLPPTGPGEAPAAVAWNPALIADGALGSGQTNPSHRTITGQVRCSDDSPFDGHVIVFDEHPDEPMRLGEGSTDPEGRYRIGYTLPENAGVVRLRVAAFDHDGQRRAEETADATQSFAMVNLTVRDPGHFRVGGRVFGEARAAVGGHQVVVIDKNVGGETELTETTSGPDGSYSVAFTYCGIKDSPDLQARAFTAGPERIVLGESEVRYNAGSSETLDIPVAAEARQSVVAEHEAITGDITKYHTQNLRDLQENGERQDITFLANKTGWDARAVALASVADKLSAETSDRAGAAAIAPAFYYALFRAGVPAEDAAIYRTPVSTVEAVWKQAIDEGVVPAGLAEQLPEALDRFTALSARHAVTGPALAGRSSLAEMLRVSLPNADGTTGLAASPPDASGPGGDIPSAFERFARLQIQHQDDDPTTFWEAVREEFGSAAAERLQLDGKLAYLTQNNAPLIAELHARAEQEGGSRLRDPVDLIQRGYYHAAPWLELIDTPPPQIPGVDEPTKKANYAQMLATELRLSYATSTVAAMVKAEETPAENAAKVNDFLLTHQATFDIDAQPVEQFAAQNQIQVDPGVSSDVARIQRVRQITSSDAAMNTLLGKGIGSAFDVTRYDRAEFVAAFAGQINAAEAALIHARAQQIHSAVLNIATSYALATNGPTIGVHSPAQTINPRPNVPANPGDVIAYPTLESLVGEMDYCDCEECRSVLSPAAYLVDLLQWLDRGQEQWKQFLANWQHGRPAKPDEPEPPRPPYPYTGMQAWIDAGRPRNTEITPLQVLLSRRPDIQHLPLTCENTTIAIPYIDLVNETLEYFVANNNKLDGYHGHTTDDRSSSAELLANPAFVERSAYDILAGKGVGGTALPPSGMLPWNQDLERLRRLLGASEVSLSQVMQALRKNDSVEQTAGASYGWRDIWIEEFHLSRAESAILTDGTRKLWQLYGFAPNATDSEVVAGLSNAKDFARRVDISYEELVAVLKTRFINPNGAVIPKLDRLGVSLQNLKAFKEGKLNDQQFDQLISPQVDRAQFSDDIKAWVRANYDKIMQLLLLADPTRATDLCSFDSLEFRYADPARAAERVRPFEFVRLLRFIRLWKKLGWSIQNTDKAISALYPGVQNPNTGTDTTDLSRLDVGFRELLPRLGVLSRVIQRLNLKVEDDLLPLLSCFAPMDTYGEDSLYRTRFLNQALLERYPVFAEDVNGGVLTGSDKLLANAEALRAALTVSGDEFTRIASALNYNVNTPLTIDTASAVFRRGWLARTMQLSIQELLLLIKHSGIDPFAAIDLAGPTILKFLDLADRLRAARLKPTQALYLIWNEDLSGTAAPTSGQVHEFVRDLRSGFAAVDSEFVIADDPDGQIARARMSQVYGDDAADLFFGLLNNTLVSQVGYAHPRPELEEPILKAAPGRISYDDFRKRMSFAGAMPIATRDNLKQAAPAKPAEAEAFKSAIDKLYEENQRIALPFFERYPELKPLHDTYVASNDPAEKKRTALLAQFLPTLQRRRKREQALHAISAATNSESVLAAAILDNAALMHAVVPLPGEPDVGASTRPALDDLVAIERRGLYTQFFFRDTATGNLDLQLRGDPTMDHRPGGANPLPPNGGKPISAKWTGYLEAPVSDAYNLRVEADPEATVTLTIGDKAVNLRRDETGLWNNASPIELTAGTLNAVTLTVAKVRDVVSIRWQIPGRGWEIIPARYLYSTALWNNVFQVYTRFAKAAFLSAALRLTADEFVHFATHADYRIGAKGWLNSLPVTGQPGGSIAPALGKALGALLDFSVLKAALSPDDGRLLTALKAPGVAARPDGLLFALTGWEPASLAALLTHFGLTQNHLAGLPTFLRVHTAFQQLTALGVAADPLIAATTNEPTATSVRDLQGALRARHSTDDWLAIVKPINDDLRVMQRDALVAYILHQMRSYPASQHIDTPEKLFEYFLMDVQMQPCMPISRIRAALSAVQLFIERTLMNLEPRVAPSALTNAAQWEWMKRYRVWEANRKVFLWPENWLEPELRDDQSPFFREMMSELLQSDITEDRAAAALGNYLAKLDTVAKLEPCGIDYVEGEPGTVDDIDYVVARTAGANRTYYWRRREPAGWTPWEQIKLDIEGNSVIPVVWKNRVFLFWVKIVSLPSPNPPQPFVAGQDLAHTKTNDIKLTQSTDRTFTVSAMLCWSEYYNGVWQPMKTSDPHQRVKIDDFVPGSFEPLRDLFTWLGAVEIDNPSDDLKKDNLQKDGDILQINIGGRVSFRLYNTHSLPVPQQSAILSGEFRPLDLRDGTWLRLQNTQYPLGVRVLTYRIQPTILQVEHTPDRWGGTYLEAPFFYSDCRHVFYVSFPPRPPQPTIAEWQRYAAPPPQAASPDVRIPPVVAQTSPPRLSPIDPVVIGPGVGISDPAPVRDFLTKHTDISKAMGFPGTVVFDGVEIGAAGGLADRRG